MVVYSSLAAQRSDTTGLYAHMHIQKNLTVSMSIMLQMSVIQNKFDLPRMSYR